MGYQLAKYKHKRLQLFAVILVLSRELEALNDHTPWKANEILRFCQMNGKRSLAITTTDRDNKDVSFDATKVIVIKIKNIDTKCPIYTFYND